MMSALPAEFAFIKVGCGKFLIGHGPFEFCAQQPAGQTAFYINDFFLQNKQPWIVPARTEWVDSLTELLPAGESVKIAWSKMEADAFAEVFAQINDAISVGLIEKSVPVAVQQGQLVEGTVLDILATMTELDEPFISYGYVAGGKGFFGATPELLFNLKGKVLQTMALAGTAKADEREVFAVDPKEIREHAFVAQTLVAKLSDIGEVEQGKRGMMDLGEIVHFLTPIEVELFDYRAVEDLIRRLHPTPALGPLPRTRETMKMLENWRSKLECPVHFGAPFGLAHDGEFTCAVAIRGVHFSGENLSLPSGCGVIEASRLMNEWRELRLKREAVKKVFSALS
ncbi:chorismate-binding protein [Persicirhabdus sediminis]|uniref:Chorismate-binding protein n=2 Tax=Persicirhabdus sediminis TaxID=454144 RepID=A0A8J7MGY6_9BACT|nr:chorismate-binding protein [Persicirhabdus sediminis]